MKFIEAVKAHWPEYLMEAWGLGTFMVSACLFTILFEHPDSLARQAISSPLLRRFFIGLAMGLTLIGIVHSPLGKRSGAHLNPAFTWSFFRLGKIQFPDAVGYSVFQFVGGAAGVLLTALFLRMALAHAAVNYAATLPGSTGPVVAFMAEFAISFGMMLTVLFISNHPKLNRFTSYFAAMLVTTYITFEAPLSGMSMNPARTFASAYSASEWSFLWIYFVAPPLGMLFAAETYRALRGVRNVYCAKFHHQNDKRCIFNCNFGELTAESSVSAIL